jgi:adenine phosphoribosyltransferase
MNVGFIPIRKQGKLPSTTISEQYELEYGTDCLEIHEDAIDQGERIILIDDLLATGGTAKAAESLLTKCGGQVVGAGFLIELGSLKGRALFKDPKLKVFSVFDFQD